jgi:hypothetical protein
MDLPSVTIPRKTLADLALWLACADHHNACAMLNPPVGTTAPPPCDCGLRSLRKELDDALASRILPQVSGEFPNRYHGGPSTFLVMDDRVPVWQPTFVVRPPLGLDTSTTSEINPGLFAPVTIADYLCATPRSISPNRAERRAGMRRGGRRP